MRNLNYPIPPSSGPIITLPENPEYPDNWAENEGKKNIHDEGNIGKKNGGDIIDWGEPWPSLPGVDTETIVSFDDAFRFNKEIKPCNNENILGYYISWHVIGAMFESENGRLPRSGYELVSYDNALNRPTRYGIHICLTSIFQYIMSFSVKKIKPDEIDEYRKYCFYLTLIYVIAHEWGHYRSDVLSIQLNKSIDSLTGRQDSPTRTHYMSYFYYEKRYASTDFEEVFAEWASLKYSIFNFHMPEPAFVQNNANWDMKKTSLRKFMTEAMLSNNRPLPYRDLDRWVDTESLISGPIIERLKTNNKSKNRSVNDNQIFKFKSLIEGRMIDFLVHNQMQFSASRPNRLPIKSNSRRYPNNPDSIFYHIGNDPCTTKWGKAHQNSDNYIKLERIKGPSTDAERFYNELIDDLLGSRYAGYDYINLPIPIFAEILPLQNVYIHL